MLTYQDSLALHVCKRVTKVTIDKKSVIMRHENVEQHVKWFTQEARKIYKSLCTRQGGKRTQKG